MKTYVGIDNGVTGSIGIVASSGYSYTREMFVYTEQSYTKAKQNITRVDHRRLIIELKALFGGVSNATAILERPMLNPIRFKASVSAMRALEATLVCLEALNISIQYIDSKEWQKAMLPKGVKGTPDLKKASVDIGCRLFPQHKDFIVKHGDCDGLLIAEFARRMSL